MESGELLLVKLFRLRATFVARPLWSSIAELSPPGPWALSKVGELSTAAKHIASFLLQHGPANTLELQQALLRQFPILPASLKKGLRELEERLIVYPLRVGDDSVGRDVHTWELLTQRLARGGCEPPPQATAEIPQDGTRAVAGLLQAALQAAHVVDATEADRWFPVIARSLAYLCVNAPGNRHASLKEKAVLLDALGLPRRDTASLLNTTDDTLRQSISQGKRKGKRKRGKKKA